MFAWLETTPVADWVALSLWAYPSLLSFHIVGLAIVVGIFAMRDLRLAGVIKDIDPQIFLKLGKLAWAGFAVNLVSGFLLFTSQATIFVVNTPFLIKICSIIAGMVVAVMIQARIRSQAGATESDDPAPGGQYNSLKPLAIMSLFIWITAISAGRLIAYF